MYMYTVSITEAILPIMNVLIERLLCFVFDNRTA